jgi:SPP1 gp7 family putative phage head morphogenesis protein
MALDPLPAEHARAALDLEATAWMRLQRIFRRAKKEMVSRLVKLLDTGHGDTVRSQHAAHTIFEVSQVLSESIPEMLASLARSTTTAIEMGAGHALEDVAANVGDPEVASQVAAFLPIDAILHISDPQEALLTKFGDGISTAAADSLGVSLTMGEGIRPAAKRLGESIEQEAWKLERIARTEINSAMNAARLAQMVAVAADFPEMGLLKQWSATSDARCCGHCDAMDGQIRALDTDFDAPDGWSGDAPPKHPNCRCAVISAGLGAVADLEGGAMKLFTLQAMALAMPDTGAPNRHPFTGILCQLDTPSTKAPGGSGGDCVILPTTVAEKILPTLLGMGVNYISDLTGHNVRQKIGVITEARIEAGAIHVSGVLWDKDFPDAVRTIQAANATGENVGMSFEIDVTLAPERAGVARIKASTGFTGAAILLRRDAAYEQTRLAAAAEGVHTMTPEELAAALAANNTNLLASVGTLITAAVAAAMPVRAASVKKGAPALTEDLDRLQDLHAAAAKSGYGDSSAMGALGEHAAHMKANADNYQDTASVQGAAVVAPDPAIATLTAAAEAQSKEIASLTARLTAQAQQPERVTVSPAISALLSRADLTPKDDAPLTAAVLTAAMDKAGMTDPVTRTQMLMALPN